MRNFIHAGNTLTMPTPYDVSSGALVIVDRLVGIACGDALAGENVQARMSGVYDLPKVNAQAWTVGAKVYYAAGTKLLTTTATDNTFIGHAIEPAANPSAVGRVRLSAHAGEPG